jgi:uncharacterized protein (TIGR03663 family)
MSELSSSENRTDFLSRPLLATMQIDWEKTIYILFLILAIVTRFYGLGDRVMSHDESLHTQFSFQFYNGDGYQHTPLMHGPFLFHLTAVSYWLFGDNDLTARIPVALFGVALVLMPYFLRSWLGRAGALFASFFFLISPYLTYYSRYIRHDIYVIVWAMIVFIATWFYFRDRNEKYLWWFAGGTALMFATKEVSFIYVAIFGSFLVLRLLPQSRQHPLVSQLVDQTAHAAADHRAGRINRRRRFHQPAANRRRGWRSHRRDRDICRRSANRRTGNRNRERKAARADIGLGTWSPASPF